MTRVAIVLMALALVACTSDVDEPWELDHDRIIAVRAEPPGIMPGETSRLDVLLGYETMPTEQKTPDAAQVVSPASLAGTLVRDDSGWVVTAPSAEAIAAARTELGLEADAPVPLVIGVGVAWPTPVTSPTGNGFAATKTVLLGVESDNPEITGLTIGGTEPPDAGEEIVISAAIDAETRLTVDADDTTDIVNWLSSCGTMHDFDLAKAYITVEEEDRREGELALVLRNERGGVTWRVWPCRAE